jgi:signal transduction histidine kinase
VNTKLPAFARSYLAALRKHVKDDAASVPIAAKALGLRAVEVGLETLDLAKIHEEALIAVVSPDEPASARGKKVRLAGQFFAEAITPIELTHRGAREANVHLKVMVEELVQRTNELTDSNQALLNEISQRKALEESLRNSEQASRQLLEKSCVLQEELRLLSRRLLSVQEEERKRISRELHDLIAQTLTGINLQLAMLKSKAISDTKEFYEKLELTRQLVEKSVDAVHRFARDLRPRHERACGNGRRQVSCGVRAGKGNHGGVTEM